MPKRSDPGNVFPDAYYAASKIKGVSRYVDGHRSIRIHQIPLPIIHTMLLNTLRAHRTFREDEVYNTNDSSFFCCFSIFHYIYLSVYREPNFASFDHFQRNFTDFQNILWLISDAYRQHGSWIHEKLPPLKLFDIKNLAQNISNMNKWNYQWQQKLR